MNKPGFVITWVALLLYLSATSLMANPQIRMTTNSGVIDIELYADKAPTTVKNILSYVDSGFYAGTLFHRVIDNFMIQGGGYTQEYQKKDTHAPVTNESYNGLSNKIGTLAMARTSNPHSATAQFFINVRNNSFLDFKKSDVGPLNTLRNSQVGIMDPESGRMATTNCRGKRITHDTLKEANKSPDDNSKGFICLMQAVLSDNNYSLDNALKQCLANQDALKQSGKIAPDGTCSDYVKQRHQGLKLVNIQWGYTVFGKVVQGMDVVNKIKTTATGSAGPFRKDAPVEPVIIQSIIRITK